MRYKLLGKSGLRVSELCLGTMTFGEEWGFGADKNESRRIFNAFAEAGGNFIDTANKYTNGTSEKYVGEFIGTDRDKYVLATKYTLSMDPNDPNSSGNHRKNMVQSVEASLKRLAFEIEAQHLEALEAVSKIELGFPHDFLEHEEVRSTVYGDTYLRIDNHRN